MNIDDLRQKLWERYYVADINVRYWKLYSERTALIEKLVRSVLALSGAVSLLTLCISSEYQTAAAVIGVLSGVISTIVIPAFGLEGFSQTVTRVRNRWIDLLWEYESMRADVWGENIPDRLISKIERDLDRWESVDRELEQFDCWLPDAKKLREIATTESESALSV